MIEKIVNWALDHKVLMASIFGALCIAGIIAWNALAIDAYPDISDTTELLDEIVNLRLCYERYNPIFLRLSHADTPEEIPQLVSCARLSGLDGLVAPTPQKVRMSLEECQGRMPVIGVAQTPEEAMEELLAGASLIETSMRPLALARLLKLLEKQTSENV